jgi:hypothetical protein
MMVQFLESFVPALFASSSFGIKILPTFLPSVFCRDFFSLASAIAKIFSIIPSFAI